MNTFFEHIKFADPWFFLLLGFIPIYIWWYFSSQRKKYVQLKMSNLKSVARYPQSLKVKLLPIQFILRCLTFASATIALARPQTSFSNENITTEGIDIVLAMDVSSSMYAIDFKPNRMTAAKEAAKEFIEGRKTDRIGMVVFAGEAFTQCPITLDHELLKLQIDQIDGWEIEDGTAIGDGLFMAVNRLSDTTQMNTKVIILITDGVQNVGEYSSLDASEAAKQLNMRVYTIGVGKKSNIPVEVRDEKRGIRTYLDPKGSFDEKVLQQIAENTGGKYFQATSKEKLTEIYQEIDAIEKQKIDISITKRFDEKFYSFAFAALLFLFLEILFSLTIFRTTT